MVGGSFVGVASPRRWVRRASQLPWSRRGMDVSRLSGWPVSVRPVSRSFVGCLAGSPRPGVAAGFVAAGFIAADCVAADFVAAGLRDRCDALASAPKAVIENAISWNRCCRPHMRIAEFRNLRSALRRIVESGLLLGRHRRTIDGREDVDVRDGRCRGSSPKGRRLEDFSARPLSAKFGTYVQRWNNSSFKESSFVASAFFCARFLPRAFVGVLRRRSFRGAGVFEAPEFSRRRSFRGAGVFEAPEFSRRRSFRGAGVFEVPEFRGAGVFEAPEFSRCRRRPRTAGDDVRGSGSAVNWENERDVAKIFRRTYFYLNSVLETGLAKRRGRDRQASLGRRCRETSPWNCWAPPIGEVRN